MPCKYFYRDMVLYTVRDEFVCKCNSKKVHSTKVQGIYFFTYNNNVSYTVT